MMMKSHCCRLALITTISMLMLFGCERSDAPPYQPQQVEAVQEEQAYAETDAVEEQAVGGFAHFLGVRAPIPASWVEQQPQSAMHQAMFSVPGTDGGTDAQIVVFYFGPGQGGSIEANIDRWKSQFRAPAGSEVHTNVRAFESHSLSTTLIEIEGEYLAMGARTHAPDQLMIAAITDTPAPASQRLFIRFVGDSATVRAHRDAFITMIEEMRWVGE